MRAMKTYVLDENLLAGEHVDTDSAAGLIVMEREIELASAQDRSAMFLFTSNWQQARRELTFKTE